MLVRLGRRETHNVPITLGGATTVPMKRLFRKSGTHIALPSFPCPFIGAQRFVDKAGAIKVKPFIGRRSEMAAANISITPAVPKATQWVPKVS